MNLMQCKNSKIQNAINASPTLSRNINYNGHLLVVSEKKIKMLKTPFVIAQSEVLQVAPQ